MLAASLLTLALVLGSCGDDEPLPLVEETYDTVILIHERSESRSWEVSRFYFIKNGKVIADRILCDDMVLGPTQYGEFQLAWNDYGNCLRVVKFKNLVEAHLDLDDLDTKANDAAPWWGMGRRMTDLQAPR